MPPVPLKVTVCGDDGSESRMVSVPLFDPDERGSKVTVIVQLELAGIEFPQVFASLKSVSFAPPTVMLVMLIAAALELVTVTGRALDVFTVTVP